MENNLTFNIEDDDFGWTYFQHRPVMSFFNIFLTILSCSIGFIGNLIVCVFKIRKMKCWNSMDILITSYSLTLIIASIWAAVLLINDYYGVSKVWLCQLEHFIQYFPVAVAIPSIFILIIISKYYAKLNLKYGLIITIVIWIIGIIRGYPYLDIIIEYDNTSLSGETFGYCKSLDGEFYKNFKLRMYILEYIIPIFVLLIILCLFKSKETSTNKNNYKYGIINAVLFYLRFISATISILHYFYVYNDYSYFQSILFYFLILIAPPVHPFTVYYFDHAFKKGTDLKDSENYGYY